MTSARPIRSSIAALSILAFCHVALRADESLKLVPWPQSVVKRAGEMALSPNSTIVFTDDELRPLATVFAREVFMTSGRMLSLEPKSGKGAAGDLALGLKKEMNREQYSIEVNSRATVLGGSYQAVALGTSTLLQSLLLEGERLSVPSMTVNDSPDSAYRGLLIDLARQWHEIDTLKQCIQLCRVYKINFLQLHLTDSESFTFPSKAFPKLPSVRPQKRRHYTLAELNDLVRFADERGVTLIPELDMPGHAGIMEKQMPEVFGSIDEAGEPRRLGCLNMANEKLYPAMDTLIGEICDVFKSSPYFHIGADEAWLARVSKTPEAQAYYKEFDLDGAHGMYCHFIIRMNEIVKKHGKQTIVWEGFRGSGSRNAQIPKDIIVMPFENAYNPSPSLAKHGYTMINTAWCPLYVVNASRQSPEHIYKWNKYEFGTGRVYERARWFRLKPTPLIIGAQMCAWEQPGWKEIPSLRSRLAPMSERIWNAQAESDFDSLNQRFQFTDQLLTRLIRPVMIRAEGLREPDLKPVDYVEHQKGFDPHLFDGILNVSLVPALPLRPGEKIHYSLDGSEPTPESPVYERVIDVDGSRIKKQWVANFPHKAELVVKARIFKDGQPIGYSQREAYRYNWIGKEPKRFRCRIYSVKKKVRKMPADVSGLTRVHEGLEPWVSLRGLPHVRKPARYAISWEGVFNVLQESEYEFNLNSFGGTSKVFIDGKLFLDRDKTDWSRTSETIKLKPGRHGIHINYCGTRDAMNLKIRTRRTGAEWLPLKSLNDLVAELNEKGEPVESPVVAAKGPAKANSSAGKRAPRVDVPAGPGAALRLNGIDQWVELPNPPERGGGNNRLTLEAWIKVDPLREGVEMAVIANHFKWYGYYFGLRGTKTDDVALTFHNIGVIGMHVTKPALKERVWTHVAVTFEGIKGVRKTTRFYVNGKPVGSFKGGRLDWPDTNQKGRTPNIGRSPEASHKNRVPNRHFSGCIDELRIWNTTRTDTELLGFYNTELTGNEEGLGGYFKFNTGSSEVIFDSSAIGGSGKIHPTGPAVARVKSGALSGPPPGKSVISTDALDFGEWEVTDGPTPSKAVTIGNEGKGQLVVVRTAIEGEDAGEFVPTWNKAKSTVEPGHSQQLKIAFAPLSAGKKTAALRIETNDPERLVSEILLSGNAKLERAPMVAHPSIPSDTSKVFAWMPLRWTKAAGADAYKLYLWKDGAAKPAQAAASLSKTRFTPDSYLDYAATYHWQVIAENQIGSTDGPVWTFTTEQENPETALPFDISPKAQRARKVIYEVPGRARLSGKEPRLKKNDAISIFGDSITHINGYVSNIQKCLSSSPFTSKLNIKVHNRGLNGGEIEHLRDGGKMYGDSQEPFDAVLAKDKPAVVVIYIGFNDFRNRPGTTLEDFDAIMRDLVSRSRKAGAKVVLATISVFGEKPDGRSRNDKKIDQYAEVTRQVASDTGSTLVDLRKVYLAYLRNHNFELQSDGTLKFPHNRILTYDSIHPNRAGNELLADHIANGIAEALKR